MKTNRFWKNRGRGIGEGFFANRRTSGLLLIAVVSVLILAGSSISAFASPQPNEDLQKYYTSIRIEKGDSLWSIADAYVRDSVLSKKEFIREVCRINQIDKDDVLKSGDYLVVVYYSE